MSLRQPRGRFRHRLTLAGPGDEVSDGRGGWTMIPTVLGDVDGDIRPAPVREMERVIGGTVQATASHLVTFDYLPGVTLQSTVTFHDDTGDRLFTISGLTDPDERHVLLICACEEVVP
jgi:head-tail adaptor